MMVDMRYVTLKKSSDMRNVMDLVLLYIAYTL